MYNTYATGMTYNTYAKRNLLLLMVILHMQNEYAIHMQTDHRLLMVFLMLTFII